MSAIAAAALADFRQRVRSFRFVVVLMATLFASVLMVPASDAGYTILQIGEARGVYNSAWIGLVFAVIAGQILPLFGFFIVKDAVQRDRATRVGLLLAATPMSKRGYVAAKFLSNVATFVAIVAASVVVAVAMQLWRGEDAAIAPWTIAYYIAVVALPVLLSVAAIAVLFECVPGLRGAFGNVVLFVAWVAALGSSFSSLDRPGGRIVERAADFFGVSVPFADFEDDLARVAPGYKRSLLIGANIGGSNKAVVPWAGLGFDGEWLVHRLLWSLLCVPFLLVAAFAFDRFDPARARRGPAETPKDEEPRDAAAAHAPWHALTPLPAFSAGAQPLAMLRAELTLLLKRQSVWWYLGVAGFWIALATAPIASALQIVVPLAWLWGLTRWSEHGARAAVHDTERLLGAAPSPIARQLPVQWLAGVAFGLALAAPLVARLAASGGVQELAQLAVGAAFVSALTLGCGALSRGPRLFELLFLLLWYAALQEAPPLMFAGRHGVDFAATAAPVYAAIAVACVLLAAGARAASLRR